MMEFFDGEGNLLCLLHKAKDWKKGLDFITPDPSYVQAGTWWYDTGTKLDRHYHNIFERTADRTCEVVYVVSGSMNVDLYDEQRRLMKTFAMVSGDTAVFIAGGHGYEITSDDTRILETKNGPFYGVEKDKTRF